MKDSQLTIAALTMKAACSEFEREYELVWGKCKSLTELGEILTNLDYFLKVHVSEPSDEYQIETRNDGAIRQLLYYPPPL